MFIRMVFRALVRQWKKMLMIAFTIALGASLATAMLNVMFDVGDKVNQELKTYGANIRVVPQSASIMSDMYGLANESYLREDELGRLKTIFWAFNIVDFAPYLDGMAHLAKISESAAGGRDFTELGDVKVTGTWFNHHLALPTGEELDTGMVAMKKWWTVTGDWLSDDDASDTAFENSADNSTGKSDLVPMRVMVGSELAQKYGLQVGDTLTLSVQNWQNKNWAFTVAGIFDAGGDEDECVYMNLSDAQWLFGKSGLISSIEVSALTTPDNDLARKAAQDPTALNQMDWDTWYCTAYVSSICYQIQEVISNSVAKAVRQVAESEGAILNKTQLLMLLITILSLIGSALGISNLVTASVMERSKEIGLLKAIGAYDGPISALILTEILLTAVVGGVLGYFAGLGFAQVIGQSVFDSSIAIKVTVIPLVAILIFVVTLAGSIPSIRLLLSLRPAEVLHGGH
ncbi:MAG: ABC transporter permease [Treponema sp.]|uniref:ABC transporter permease n=1 Tax=Treponema sp. TaxID=166 RepID=UPI0025D76F5B|nr:ABC transporter permease [Treponema sp.]MBQ8678757.1 ABC transporter permease [Treponema sp.]MBQ8681251.1 ABC transporter permease [Treponema sp.]